MSELINTIYQLNLTDVYRIFCPNIKEYTIYSEAHGRFSKISHILGEQTNLKFRKIKITPCILHNHNIIKLKTNSKQISTTYTNSRRLNNSALSDEFVHNNQEINQEFLGTK